jgi:YD repeat-containing protein
MHKFPFSVSLVALFRMFAASLAILAASVHGATSNPTKAYKFGSKYFKSQAAVCSYSFVNNGLFLPYNATTAICNGEGTYTINRTHVNEGLGADLQGNPVCKAKRTDVNTYVGSCICVGDPVVCGATSSFTVYEDIPSYAGAEVKVCPSGWSLNPKGLCQSPSASRTEAKKNPGCLGNPVDFNGCKLETIWLNQPTASARQFGLYLGYAGNTLDAGGKSLGDTNWFVDPIDKRLVIDSLVPNQILAVRSALTSVKFNRAAIGSPWQSIDRGFELGVTPAGDFFLYDPLYQTVETYGTSGNLISISKLTGAKLSLQVPAAFPTRLNLIDQTGRTSFVSYAGSFVNNATLNNGQSYAFTRGSLGFEDKLVRVTSPDLTFRSFNYLTLPKYSAALLDGGGSFSEVSVPVSPTNGPNVSAPIELPEFSMGGFSGKPLVSQMDEFGVTVGIYGVDPDGVTTSTQRAGGVGLFSFSVMGSLTSVVEPLGSIVRVDFEARNDDRSLVQSIFRRNPDSNNYQVTSFNYAGDGILNRETRQSFPSSSGSSSISTCYSTEAARDLETEKLEGRDNSDCSSLLPVAVTAERKTTTSWHPDWVLKTRIAEAKKITTLVYQGQPDPTAGNAVANCLASGAALLPNGKPLAVLCKKVEQATSDENGGLGFAAPAVGLPRVWSYSYAADGQVLVENGPRTDVTDTTTYEYYAATDTATPIKWYKGDLKKVTNAAGHVTTYDQYEPNGKPLKITDPNGVVMQMTYHVRDWLTSVSTITAGITQTTNYEYWPTGKLKKVTQPDGSYLSYGYDAAQRLTSVADNLNNQVLYTLDNAGNRTKEEFKDAGGALKRNISRAFDSLSRLQSVTGALQ